MNNNLVRLEGTIASAVGARKALNVARDLMPEGEDRDEIIGLMAHLRHALDDLDYEKDVNDVFPSSN